MGRQDISKFILERLAAAGNRDDLIRDVCLRAGIAWPEAEALVDQVEAKDEKTILRRQSPVALTTSIMFVLAGMLITGLAAFSLFWPVFQKGIFFLDYIFYLIQFGHPMMLVLFIGLAFSIGGMIAFFDTIFRLIEK
jgi:hypothetical protein